MNHDRICPICKQEVSIFDVHYRVNGYTLHSSIVLHEDGVSYVRYCFDEYQNSLEMDERARRAGL